MLTPSHVADAIYAISDAGDNYSKGTIDRVRTRLLVSGVRLHLIYIGDNAIAFSRAPLTAVERKTAIPILSVYYFSDDKPDTFSTLALESGGWVLDVPASLEQENARVRGTIAAAVHAMVGDPLIEVQLGAA